MYTQQPQTTTTHTQTQTQAHTFVVAYNNFFRPITRSYPKLFEYLFRSPSVCTSCFPRHSRSNACSASQVSTFAEFIGHGCVFSFVALPFHVFVASIALFTCSIETNRNEIGDELKRPMSLKQSSEIRERRSRKKKP